MNAPSAILDEPYCTTPSIRPSASSTWPWVTSLPPSPTQTLTSRPSIA